MSAPIAADSLEEAWLQILDKCWVGTTDNLLDRTTLGLSRVCFYSGAVWALKLLQQEQAEQLMRDLAGFAKEGAR